MNIQAMMKQAQKLQKDMMNAKSEIDNKEYTYSSSIVNVKAMGTKKITEIKINMENIENDDKEMLEDAIIVGVNNVLKQIDDDTEQKLGKYTQGMPGLF